MFCIVVAVEDFGLNDKESLFVLEYMKDLSPKAAAVRAGYSEGHGSELMRRERIQQAVNYALVQRAQAAGADAVAVVQEVLAMARECRTRQLWDEATRAYKLVLAHLGEGKGSGGGNSINIFIGRDDTDKELAGRKELDSTAAVISGRLNGAGALQLPAREPHT